MALPEINIKNKRARFEYHLEEEFTAGIQLSGTEIKSIRAGKASILEAYCISIESEVWIRNMHITTYENGSIYNHKPRADRKLLLQKKDINSIIKFLKIDFFLFNRNHLLNLNYSLSQFPSFFLFS